MSKYSPDEFEKLDPAAKKAEIALVDETERQWWVTCPKCKFKMIGTLQELRGKPCGVCGYGSEKAE
jgi:hypothetical protein